MAAVAGANVRARRDKGQIRRNGGWERLPPSSHSAAGIHQMIEPPLRNSLAPSTSRVRPLPRSVLKLARATQGDACSRGGETKTTFAYMGQGPASLCSLRRGRRFLPSPLSFSIRGPSKRPSPSLSCLVRRLRARWQIGERAELRGEMRAAAAAAGAGTRYA